MATKQVTPESLRNEMARYLDAARNKGFDGNEHPELLHEVEMMLGVIYPITLEDIAKTLNQLSLGSK